MESEGLTGICQFVSRIVLSKNSLYPFDYLTMNLFASEQLACKYISLCLESLTERGCVFMNNKRKTHTSQEVFYVASLLIPH